MWVYSHNGHKVGPVTFEEIVSQIHAGIIVQNTAVCCSGEKPCQAGQHPKLQPYFVSMNKAASNIVSGSQEVSSSNTSSGTDNQTSPFPQFQLPNSSSGHKRASTKKAHSSKTKLSAGQWLFFFCLIACCCFGYWVSEHPSPKSLDNEGIYYFDHQEYDKALECWKKAAEQGCVDSYANLGMLYSSGARGVPIDMNEAIKWYRKAADQGHSHAQHMLGNFYIDGRGVAKNRQEAIKWYYKAAKQGYEYSVDMLHILAEKEGDKDAIEALKRL